MKILDFSSKIIVLFMREIDSAHPRNVKMHPWSEFSYSRFNQHSYFIESGKHFQTLGMSAIDFSHKITPRKVIFAKIQKKIFCKKLFEKSQKFSFFATLRPLPLALPGYATVYWCWCLSLVKSKWQTKINMFFLSINLELFSCNRIVVFVNL